ncbi:ACP S-malonyltransferase [Basilea psittacipulmonis]|uniref:Malonyl CoA-acyl carrier protein transacylase n=1 Tax=Basilea psittacipulmonis DSM 24701 TaxID=1072685 RepID=A0A077DEJ3_9BURK|nr:ACP S-malonyltransferase [Basilea psittacipulmonis]AIL33250.1 ACP S-malonyltransferase [Basilea psittacipulmonis DSM 24701]
MKLAFLFPGQGSQTVGMLDAWSDNEQVKEVMQLADQALSQDLSGLIKNGPAEDLNLTTNTQPAMLAASVAMYRAYLAKGGRQPDCMAGHSLGEYSALTAAGTFKLEDAVRLVRVRADAMQAQVPVGVGAMAAIIGLDDETVIDVCSKAAEGDVVQAVNFNAPSQVVIAGHKTAVERACELAKAAGAKRALLLPVSAPFHSRLLEPVGKILENFMSTIQVNMPTVPIINNVDVGVSTSPSEIVDALSRQAWHPVRWVETIKHLHAQGVTHVVECGPGKVLVGLMKRIEPSMTALSITDPESLQATLEALSV